MARFLCSRNSRRGLALWAAAVFMLLCRCDDPGAPPDFSVTVKVFTHERLCLWTYEVTPGRLCVMKHSTGGGPGETVLERPLSGSERRRLGGLMAGFPLDSLQERYADTVVTGNRSYTFAVRVRDREKRVHVYYEVQDDLARLAGEIDQLLPARYRIGYR
ncbi:MAG: hypothetical protein JXA20_05285 [Spirochaetes bacterium]|nr:hypothetical protein [Spirochaetota bacterium]